jgi:very-short-patch-repair endonuclease
MVNRVYEFFYLFTLHREKRVQMVRELTALFQLLRENSRRESFHLKKSQRPEKYIVDFYDAFRFVLHLVIRVDLACLIVFWRCTATWKMVWYV